MSFAGWDAVPKQWLRTWAELNGYEIMESESGWGDQWFVFHRTTASHPGDGFNINKNIEIEEFLRVYGDRHV